MTKNNPVRSSLAKVLTGLPSRSFFKTTAGQARLPTGQKIIVIVGPTASGKSGLAIKLAKKCPGEIISADSRQVYRGMDIGTGKVKKVKYKDCLCKNTKAVFVSKGIRHHLIDVANPKRQFTASDFKKLGEKAIKKILGKGKVPIIVGGTGFYIDVLLGRMAVAKVPPNKKLRERFDKLSADHLFKMLRKLDPRRAKNIDKHNKRRLVRALEIVLTTGKTVPSFTNCYTEVSQFKKALKNKPKYSVLWLGLKPKNLEKRIKKRLDTRLGQGMIGEVKRLHSQGVSWKRLDDFGLEYRWVSRWLIKNEKIKVKNDNEKLKNFKKSEHYENLLRDIVRYSKRQMTWFKKNKEIHWLS